jgi:hypothetical protein
MNEAVQAKQVFKDNPQLRHFLFELFQCSGMFGNLDLQGKAWTLKLLSSDVGGGVGRTWFTLNIGTHAFAYTERKTVGDKFTHCMSLDRLIVDYPETIIWVGKHDGEVREALYRTAERAVEIIFDADFATAAKIFKLPGLRRALVAYWSATLADMRERGAQSVYARHHCPDTVEELLAYKRATEKRTATVLQNSHP